MRIMPPEILMRSHAGYFITDSQPRYYQYSSRYDLRTPLFIALTCIEERKSPSSKSELTLYNLDVMTEEHTSYKTVGLPAIVL